MESLCLVVPKKEGEVARKKVLEAGLIKTDLKINSDEDNVYIPLIQEFPSDYLFTRHEFEKVEEAPRSYRDMLNLPPEFQSLLPSSFDIVGEIAIIKLSSKLGPYREEIAEALMTAHKKVKSVALDSGVEGEFRVRQLKILAGRKNLETVHREFGISLTLDPSRVYFSPRLATERWRVAQETKKGEVVADMFCGVGPFSILIAKRRSPKRVYAFDSNPVAIDYLRKNITINRVQRIESVLGDSIIEVLKIEPLDRVIMDLPHSAFEYLGSALKALKEHGWIHYYEIMEEREIEDRKEMITAQARDVGRRISSMEVREVRSYSPAQGHYAFDVEVSPA